MREILFRGFRQHNGGEETISLNGKTVIGDWIIGWYGKFVLSCGWNLVDAVVSQEDAVEGKWEAQRVIPETIGQFTGLFDKNGKQGFEHDVVKRGKSTGVIKFGDGRFYVDWGENPEFWSDTLCVHLKDSEITGTIFDVKESTND